MSASGNPTARLKSFVERLERLEQEKAAISDHIKEVKSEAKMYGLDVPTIVEIIKLRKLTPQQRDEREALLDIYKASLGMLHDTPLGEAARRRLTPKKETQDNDQDDNDEGSNPASIEPVSDPLHNITEDQAREMGKEAAAGGKPVTDNPFPARDKRRAAWDEAWCEASGSDGMEIPEAWRRQKPETESKSDETDDNSEDKDAA